MKWRLLVNIRLITWLLLSLVALAPVFSSNAGLTGNPSPACTPAHSGLAGWWAGEGNANDVVGTNNGTLVNGVSFVPGEVDQAFSFDGGSSYVSIPDSPSLDALTSSITIELWLKADQLTANRDWKGIVTKGNSSWRLQGTAEADTVTFSASGVRPNGDLYGSRNVNDGQWHHVAAVYDGACMFIYVDGMLDVSQPAMGSIAQNGDLVCFGANAQGAYGYPMYFFNGLIDEVSIYNRALTASEIQAIYAAGSGGKCHTPTAPEIISQPTNQTEYLGFTASFNVVASGAPSLDYQWSFEGTNIVWATNSTLTLTNVQLNQAGNYAVLVTDIDGSVLSSNAVLTVLAVPPVIVSQPTNQTVMVGDTASFSVTASGALPLSYQWSFNGTNIDGATNTSLTLTNVQFSQAGNYAVLVTNAYDSVLSSNAVLTVNPLPPCAPVSSGLVSWWPGEGDANDVIGANNGTLVNDVDFVAGEVGQAFSFDGAIYTYVSIPDSPSLDSLTTNITIEAWIKVDWFDPSENWDALVTKGNSSWRLNRYGNTSQIGFGTTGLSNEDLGGNRNVNDGQWHHVAAVYDGTTKFIYVDGTLDVSTPATGSIAQNSYPVCIGENAETMQYSFDGLIDEVSIYNRALSTVEIQAIYEAGCSGKCALPPTIIVQPTDQVVAAGGMATFSVTTTGTPPLSYQWNFNGTNIDGATNTSLTLTNVQFSQAGNYAVLVTNLYGSILSSNAVLTVNPPPPCAPAPSGLVSWWPGEGDANDVVGSNNGMLVNSVGYVAGEVGQAFSFDGTSYVSIPDSPLLDSLTTNITIEAWFKVSWFDPNRDWDALVTKGNSSWRLNRQGSSSQIGFSTTGLSNESLGGNRNVNDGQWHHVAAVYDGTAKYLYVDGTLDVSTPATGSIAQNSYPVCIGQDAQMTGYLFDGLIDEVSIYNRALTASEIQAIYAADSGGKCPLTLPIIMSQPTNQTVTVGGTAVFNVMVSGAQPLSYQWNFEGTNIDWATNTSLALTNVQFNQAGNYMVLVTNVYGSILSSNAVLMVNPPPPCAPVPSGLVSWWPGEGNANDIAGTNNGTLVIGAGFALGEVGQAFSFDGASSYVSIPDSPSLDAFTSNITIEAWINVNQFPGSDWTAIVTKGDSSWRLHRNGSTSAIAFSVGGLDTGNLAGTRNVNDGQWHHVAGVYDGTNLFLYVDGVLDASAPATGSIAQNTYPVCIGENAQHRGRLWNGLIDEVSIYNRALSTVEIQAIYEAGCSGKCALPPTIIVQPADQVVAAGGTASFGVIASGTPPLSYQWNFNGTNIDWATNASLTLTNVQLSQAGNYAVLVTNAYDSVLSSNAVLTVTPDHFAWNPIPSPRFVNTPFFVIIRAQDMTNGLFTNFTGTAILGTTNGIAVTPPVSGNFIQGVWTGSVAIAQPASDLVLQADDGFGHFGLANPINVLSLPELGMWHSGNIALFMWPAGYPGFVLETSGNLSPAAWVVVPYAPFQFGDEYFLPLNMTGTNGFYRLRFSNP